MKNRLMLAPLLALLLLATACNQAPPDYSSAEAFVRDFVQTLKDGGDYRSYYLDKSDFADDESSQMTVARFTEFVKENFLRRCRNAHDLMKGKALSIESVELIPREKKAATFLHSVGTVHKALVQIKIGEESLLLDIEEVVQIGEEYRLVLFTTIVDHGTTKVPDIIIGEEK
jgi:hypothetical protein